ncbi:MAG: glycoside hydrolase family 16 protein [Bacteroidaceae bacterium]|nr:glycoside hydrolase family 16 protein [Bacteroidaceae bacterium]
MKILLSAITAFMLTTNTSAQQYTTLVWADEFNTDGKPDSKTWNYEEGFVRNHEDQWYQSDNAYQKDGLLIIECRKEQQPRPNPWYDATSNHWSKSRKEIKYTSACLTTRRKFDFLYGRLEVRARIPVAYGAWPAIWTLGNKMEWPSCGEIDLMEFYRTDGKPYILANYAWGNERHYNAEWNSKKIPYEHFLEKDPFWATRFHTWRMDWDKDTIRIYLDDELLNEVAQSTTINGSIGKHISPFTQPHYILLNLALGGDNGGNIDDTAFPMRYEIDYVRVYK